MAKRFRHALFLCFIAAWGLTLFGCSKTNDPEAAAYDEVLATMSMQKAREFFIRYPGSTRSDALVANILQWCDRENTVECYGMLLGALPDNHPRRNEVMKIYGKKRLQP